MAETRGTGAGNNRPDGPPDATATFVSKPSSADQTPFPGAGDGQPDPFIGRVLSHYRLDGVLGAGGMGVVYRATDLTLGRAIAIKLLSRKLASSEEAKARFLREARAASALDHPNIGAVYDGGEEDGELFIVMPLYDGESLKHRLDSGPLRKSEIPNILRQIAEGLQAAHRAGIVHRDIKPANLIVTSAGTVKILDFGLAKLLQDVPAGVTRTGEALGTLLYMSPEQLRGEAVDQRSDLWSLGVVAHELASGVSPFRADSNAVTATRILHDPPPSLATVPGVPDWLPELISELLQKDPAERLQSAAEVIDRLDQVARGVAPLRKRSRLPWAVAIALLAAAIGAAAFFLYNRGVVPKLAVSIPAAPAPRKSVAVLGFKNLGQRPDAAWISTAVSEMLTTELASGEQLRLSSGENVARMKSDLSLAEADSFSSETLARIHKLLGTDYVVYGSYLALGKEAIGKLRLDLRLQAISDGQTLVALSESGPESELAELVTRIGSRLRTRLGLGAVSENEVQVVRGSMPTTPEAARLYSEGLTKQRADDLSGARVLLEKATRAEPDFPLAHSALSQLLRELGLDEKAHEEAKLAFEHSKKLSHEERLLVEARLRDAANEQEKAAEAYRALFQFFPDNADYGIELAAKLFDTHRVQEAFATLEALRRLPLTVSQEANVNFLDVVERDDVRASRDLAAQSAMKAEAGGARRLAAWHKCLEAQKSNWLGDLDRAVAAVSDSERLFTSVGDRSGLARALGVKAELLLSRAAPDWRLPGQKATQTIQELGSIFFEFLPLQELAVGAMTSGEVKESRRLLERMSSINQELGGSFARQVQRNQAKLALLEGRLDDASKMLTEAQQKKFYTLEGAHNLDSMGKLLFQRGDIPASRKAFDDALTIYRKQGVRPSELGARVEMAEVTLAEKRFPEAQKQTREVLEEIQKMGTLILEPAARLVLARALLAQGQIEDARSALDRAAEIANRAVLRIQMLEAAIVRAQLLAVSERPDAVAQALQLLEKTRAEAKERELLFVEFEARQATAQIEIKTHRPEGPAHLATLKRDAAKAGFGYFALDT